MISKIRLAWRILTYGWKVYKWIKAEKKALGL